MKRDCVCPKARHVHGTRGAYMKDGCRCFPCRIAAHAASRRAAAGQTHADPGMWVPRCAVARRIEALQAIGHSVTEIARAAGMTKQAVRDFRLRNSPVVHHATAAKFIAVYDHLWDKPATGKYADRTRRWAASQGFAPPLAWDDDTISDPDAVPLLDVSTGSSEPDEIAVERFMAGTLRDKVNANASPERVEAVRRLVARGYSDYEIGRRLGMTATNVQHFRDRRGIPSGASRNGEAA
jgi:hypothetical protein